MLNSGRNAQILARASILLIGFGIFQLHSEYAALQRPLHDVSQPHERQWSTDFVHELGQDEDEQYAVTKELWEEESWTNSLQDIFQATSSHSKHATLSDVNLIHQARDFLSSRKKVYQDLGLIKNWHLRGIAYLSEHHDMLLAGQVLLPDPDGVPYLSTKGQVVIHNVHPTAIGGISGDGPKRDCHLLEVWVRVRGPEVFAGGATPVQPDDETMNCYWVFDFDLQVSGDYIVESKVLLWNGKEIKHDGTNQCVAENGNVSQAILEQYDHIGFRGFKLYDAAVSCCEFCSRQTNPPCRFWSSPPLKMEDPTWFVNGCEFFFDKGTPVEDLPFLSPILNDLTVYNFTGFDKAMGKAKKNRYLSEASSISPELQQHFSLLEDDPSRHHHRRRRLGEMQRVHGYPHNASTAYFVGCGWHQMFTLDFPCVSGELDDKVYFAQESFTYQRPNPAEPRTEPLPLCQHDDELMDNSNGRWVKEAWPNETQCPLEFGYDTEFNGRFKITKSDPDHPHCWHRDDLSVVGYKCGEMNCHFIWEGSRWTSSFREEQFMSVWRQYSCDYYEYTDEQLQQCLDVKKIAEFKFDGQSVARSFEQNVRLRLQNLELYNHTLPDAKKVTLSTLKLLHETTHADKDILASWMKHYKNMTETPNHFFYIANGFYLTSERETFCFVDRMRQFNYMLEGYFLPRGYHVLNAFDVSKAVSYETAGQFDGMHLVSSCQH